MQVSSTPVIMFASFDAIMNGDRRFLLLFFLSFFFLPFFLLLEVRRDERRRDYGEDELEDNGGSIGQGTETSNKRGVRSRVTQRGPVTGLARAGGEGEGGTGCKSGGHMSRRRTGRACSWSARFVLCWGVGWARQ